MHKLKSQFIEQKSSIHQEGHIFHFENMYLEFYFTYRLLNIALSIMTTVYKSECIILSYDFLIALYLNGLHIVSELSQFYFQYYLLYQNGLLLGYGDSKQSFNLHTQHLQSALFLSLSFLWCGEFNLVFISYIIT